MSDARALVEKILEAVVNPDPTEIIGIPEIDQIVPVQGDEDSAELIAHVGKRQYLIRVVRIPIG